MMILQALLLLLLAAGGAIVVLTRTPRRQVIALTFYGSFWTILFMTLQAPDVALSQMAVGAGLVPLMLLAALANIQSETERKRKEEKKAEGLEEEEKGVE